MIFEFIVICFILIGIASFFFVKTLNLKSKLAEANKRIKDFQGNNNTFSKSHNLGLVSDHKHGLARLNRRQNSADTWDWRCECGRTGMVMWSTPGGGTEENAIKNWKKHVEVHEKYLVPTHEHSHAMCDKRFVGLWSLFERFRAACYCQAANDELIILNQEVKAVEKSLEKSSEKGVQEPA